MVDSGGRRETAARVDGVLERLGSVETKLDVLTASVDQRFDEVAEAFVDQRRSTELAYERLDARITQLDAKVTGLDSKVTALDEKVTTLDAKVDTLEGRMGSGFVRIERRIDLMDRRMDRMDRKLDQLIARG